MAIKKTVKKSRGTKRGSKTVRTLAKVKQRNVAAHEVEPFSAGLEVVASQEVLKGNYSNSANVTHTKREFVLDFVFSMPGHNSLVSRIITSPAHAKRLAEVLTENVQKFESKFGEIGPDE